MILYKISEKNIIDEYNKYLLLILLLNLVKLIKLDKKGLNKV
jgi:hypothetical protein